MRKRSFGKARWSQLISPATASTRPNTITQTGSNCEKQRGDRNAGHEQAHGYRRTRSPETITDIVERQHEQDILEDAGPEHRPHGHGSCKCVGNHEKSAEKRYIYAEGVSSKQTQPAHYGGGEEPRQTMAPNWNTMQKSTRPP